MKLSDFPNVWKVFSQVPLSKTELKEIFVEINEVQMLDKVYVADWLAYPEYAVHQKEAKSAFFRYIWILTYFKQMKICLSASHIIILYPFRLHRHLYYTNGIEWSASAMEMSVIAAKNIGNMAYKDWRGHFLESNDIGGSNSEDKHNYKRQQLEL